MRTMAKLSRMKIIEKLARAEQLAPTDPEAEYAVSILMDDAQAACELANDIRKCLASQGLEPRSIN